MITLIVFLLLFRCAINHCYYILVESRSWFQQLVSERVALDLVDFQGFILTKKEDLITSTEADSENWVRSSFFFLEKEPTTLIQIKGNNYKLIEN